ncbi:MAG TPA: helix-turn-helix domain-containing protein [Acidimicrobiales bacterium]|nr:helix-turn-helix domain-containing protein [Acidimicrobiales bacterium]
MASHAGDVLREARKRARLSQTDVARRSGVAQSVISAYESGRREPGVHTLGRLVQATGHQLELDIVPVPDRQLGLPDTPLGRRLRRRRRAIIETAANRGAHNVRIFGSVARGEDTAASDVDFLVDLDSGVGVVGLAGLKRDLTDLLGVDVDVVPAETLKPRIRAEVLAEAIPL